MPGADDGLGKKAEGKIREWLSPKSDDPSKWFYRLPDQMTGKYGSTNPCDFFYFKFPTFWAIESKATWADRFDFSMLTEHQHDSLLEYSTRDNVNGVVIVLFASYKRAFVIDINEIKRLEDQNIKSLNIKKIAKWPCRYYEIPAIPNARKQLLDYTGDLVMN